MDVIPYSERILRRHRVWWREPTEGVHPASECFAPLDRDAPESAWRCCPYWQRKLSNKWNAREFASRHGIAVPELYWHGTDIDAAPWSALPEAYVARPNMGYSAHGIQVMLGNRECIARKRRTQQGVRAYMHDYLGRHEYEHLIYMLEEYVRDEDASYGRPPNIRCHVFDGNLLTIQYSASLLRWKRWRRRWKTFANLYTPTWKPIDKLLAAARPRGPWVQAPRCLDQIVAGAETLGRQFGSYCAIDFYATDKGAVLAEFTPTPRRGQGFTPYVEETFGQAWQQHCPDAL